MIWHYAASVIITMFNIKLYSIQNHNYKGRTLSIYRADSRFAPSQWETALLCNDVSHWLGASLESALYIHTKTKQKPKQLRHGVFSHEVHVYCVYISEVWCKYTDILITKLGHQCHVFGTMPSAKQMITYSQLYHSEQVIVKFWPKYIKKSVTEMHLKCLSAKYHTLYSSFNAMIYSNSKVSCT